MASRSLQVVFSASTAALSRAFGQVGDDAKRFGRNAERGGQGLRNLSAAAAVAGAATVGVLAIGIKKAATAAMEAEASNARLNAQLNALGIRSTQVRSKIDQTVQSLSRMSGFDDEDLQDAFTSLVRTTGDASTSMRDLSLVTDIARGRQISLSQAAQLVNRVQAGNVGSLRKLGIEVDKTTTKEEALALLRKKFAGQAQGFGNTAAGAAERMRVAMENAFETIGVALTPLIVAFSNWAADTLPKVVNALMQNKEVVLAVAGALGVLWAGLAGARAINTFATAFGVLNTVMNANPFVRIASLIAVVVGALITAWKTSETFRDVVKDAWAAVQSAISPVVNFIRGPLVAAWNVISGVVKTLAALLRGDFSAAWDGIKQVVGGVITGIKTTLGRIPQALLDAVVEVAKAAYDLGKKILDKILEGLADLPGAIKRKVSEAFGIAGEEGAINPYLPAIQGQGRRIASGMATGVSANQGTLRGAVGDAIENAESGNKGKASSAGREIGGALNSGIASGLRYTFNTVKDAWTDIIELAKQAAKRAAGIRSPSRVFAAEIGAPMAQGIAAGVLSEASTVRRAISDISGADVGPSFSGSVRAATGARGGASVINLTFNGVLDARDAARVLQPELDRLVRLGI